MGERQRLTGDDVVAAADQVVHTLRQVVDRDWSVPAGSLEWTCVETADHTGRALFIYASQLAVRPADRYVGFAARVREESSTADLLEFLQAGAVILATVVRASPPQTRAFHPYGVSDPEGFAGMGCVETLMHGYDIASGFGLPLDPPADLCARVIARMFPDLDADDADDVDPWTALRYATGRVALPGRPAVTEWQWHGEPLPAPA